MFHSCFPCWFKIQNYFLQNLNNGQVFTYYLRPIRKNAFLFVSHHRLHLIRLSPGQARPKTETKKRRIYFSLCRITGRIPSGRESTLQVLPRVATISSGCLLPQVMLAHLQLQHAKNSNFFITCAYPKAKILPNEKKKMIVKLLKKVIHLRKLRGGGGICAFLAIVKVLAKVLLERRATPRLVDREQI